MEKIENKINLSDSIDFLIEKLKHLTDIDLDYYNRKFLIKRIHFRMNNLNYSAYQAYFDYIISHPPEIDYFLDKFTINYTYFFRNFEVFEKLKSVIIDFKKKKAMNHCIFGLVDVQQERNHIQLQFFLIN